MNEVFKQRTNSHYNLRHNLQFFVNPIYSIYNGTESASYLGPKIWKQIPSEIRNKMSLEGFKREIKKWKPMFLGLLKHDLYQLNLLFIFLPTSPTYSREHPQQGIK